MKKYIYLALREQDAVSIDGLIGDYLALRVDGSRPDLRKLLLRLRKKITKLNEVQNAN